MYPAQSRFAIISLLILLAISMPANVYIAHLNPAKFPIKTRLTGWFSTAQPSPSDPVTWPTIPDEILDELGPPDQWTKVIQNTQRYSKVKWSSEIDPDLTRELLIEVNFGIPLKVRSTKSVTRFGYSSYRMIWPIEDGTEPDDAATTYHPLGLILNPIIYALPIWFMLLLMRHGLIAKRTARRIANAQCPHCAYDLTGTQTLPTCPECGHPNEATPTPT